MSWRFVVSLFFALLVALFAIQNATVVDVNFLTWKVGLPQGVIIIIAAAAGAIIVFLFSIVKRLQIGAALRSDKKTIAGLEESNRNLQAKLDAHIQREKTAAQAAEKAVAQAAENAAAKTEAE